MTAPARHDGRIPRLADDDSPAAAEQRMRFLRAVTGTSPEHIGRYSADLPDSPGTSRISLALRRCRSG